MLCEHGLYTQLHVRSWPLAHKVDRILNILNANIHINTYTTFIIIGHTKIVMGIPVWATECVNCFWGTYSN